MRVSYDNEADAVYIQFNAEKPEGVVEVMEGMHLDLMPDGRMGGIEILHASKKMDPGTLLTYTIDDEIAMTISRRRA